VAGELQQSLGGARLRAIHLDPVARTVLLFFREATLAVKLHPDDGAFALQEPMEPLAHARPFARTLVRVEAPPDDRLLLLHLRSVRGSREPWLLALELMANRSNAVLAEGDECRVRHVLREREGDAPLRRGLVYAPPPRSTREGLDGDYSLERWRALLTPVPPGRRRGALLSTVAWTSALNVAALLGDAAHEDGHAADAAIDAGHALWKRLLAAAAAPSPVLLRQGGVLQPYPMALPDTPAEPCDTLLDAFRQAAEARGISAANVVPGEWLQALEQEADRLRRRAESLERELAATSDPESTRALGDLLLARYAAVPGGAHRVRLENFEGETIEIELDPAMAPHENAARYYETAARAERARERIPRLAEAAHQQADALEALLGRARSGEAEPEEVRGALPADLEHRSPGDSGPGLPYRRYRSSGGLEIRVGRGSKKNDDLTFHHSSPDDVWLHARHAAGAHVVLRWRGEGSPPAQDLAEAAVLAALHSKARTSSSVPVDWTRRKYVRKPRKAPPGAVLVERARTVFVDPDAELEERLREDG